MLIKLFLSCKLRNSIYVIPATRLQRQQSVLRGGQEVGINGYREEMDPRLRGDDIGVGSFVIQNF
jgi:hypothetical protein